MILPFLESPQYETISPQIISKNIFDVERHLFVLADVNQNNMFNTVSHPQPVLDNLQIKP